MIWRELIRWGALVGVGLMGLVLIWAVGSPPEPSAEQAWTFLKGLTLLATLAVMIRVGKPFL